MKTMLLLFPLTLFAFQPSLIGKAKIDRAPDYLSSPNGRYHAEIEYSTGNSEFVPISRFVLRDEQGSIVYEKSNYRHTTFDIANNGAVVGIDFDGPVSGRAVLNFYDPKGALLGTSSVSFLNGTAFSSNGSVYCVHDGINGLRVFSPDGTELHNLGTGNWFTVSPDGNRVALARDKDIVLFGDGVELGRIPLSSPFIRQMKFSPDGNQFVFADRKNLYLYRVAQTRQMFRYSEKNPNLNFISVDIAPDHPLIAAALDEDMGRGALSRHVHGMVFLFDTSGRLLWQNEIRYSKWNTHIPDVFFSGSRRLSVRTLEEQYEFSY
jgi:hypothetical protein